MKIGIFDPYLDDLGGGEKYMMTLAQCLSKDNSVVVFWNKQEDLKQVAKRFSLDISKIVLKNNIFSPDYPFYKRCLESLNYDAIVVLSDGSIPFVLSKKLILHFQQPLPSIKMSLKSNLKKMRASSFICNSFFTKSYIDKEFGVKSKVIYPPVNIEFKEGKKENIVLHVGRFRVVNASDDYKKQGVMIDVFKKMVDSGLKNWKFILAVGLRESDKTKFDQLRKKADGYPIEFMINLDNDGLGKLYSKSKIYWHASGYGENLINKPELAEHFGITTVEAMGYGVVPVVIDAGGQKEIVEDGKDGYLWNTLKDLSEKTESLIRNDKMWEEMSENARKKSNIFGGDRFCNEIRELIK
jgi:glycosyltransferase involved in cell wall biosynthesis